MWKSKITRFYTLLVCQSKQIFFPNQVSIQNFPVTKLYKEGSVHYILKYSDSRVRELVHQIKFSKNKKCFEYIGKELSQHLPDNSDVILLPVPQTKSRMRERGYDVTHTLVREIQKHISIQDGHGILKNERKDVQSKIKDRDKRISSVSGTINLTKDVRGKKFIILDDVFTTGSTLREAKKVIEENGGEVIYSICIAH